MQDNNVSLQLMLFDMIRGINIPYDVVRIIKMEMNYTIYDQP